MSGFGTMVKGLAGLLAIMLLLQQAAAAQTPEPDSACHWKVCLTKEQLIVAGAIVAGAAAGTAMTASAYAPEQAAELAAGVVLSGMFSAAASIAILGITAYHYGPQLWQHFGYGVGRPPEQAD